VGKHGHGLAFDLAYPCAMPTAILSWQQVDEFRRLIPRVVNHRLVQTAETRPGWPRVCDAEDLMTSTMKSDPGARLSILQYRKGRPPRLPGTSRVPAPGEAGVAQPPTHCLRPARLQPRQPLSLESRAVEGSLLGSCLNSPGSCLSDFAFRTNRTPDASVWTSVGGRPLSSPTSNHAARWRSRSHRTKLTSPPTVETENGRLVAPSAGPRDAYSVAISGCLGNL